MSARIQAWLRMGASVDDCVQTLLAEEYCVDGYPVDEAGALRVVSGALSTKNSGVDAVSV